MNKVRFVLGFLFDQQKKNFIGIIKTHPEWMKGKINGVGGRINEGESIADAMQREFLEETGSSIHQWIVRGEMCCPDSHVYLLSCVARTPKEFLFVHSMTEEEVCYISAEELPYEKILPNLAWIVPLLLDDDVTYFQIEDKTTFKR